jgi:threonyl-tRNA synthetase
MWLPWTGVQPNCSQEQKKVKVFRLDHVPYMLVIGQREAEEGAVSVRHRDKDDLGAKPLDEFIAEITAEIRSRSL